MDELLARDRRREWMMEGNSRINLSMLMEKEERRTEIGKKADYIAGADELSTAILVFDETWSEDRENEFVAESRRNRAR